MFDCVPDPVCHTTNGKWSTSFNEATSSAACCIAWASFGSESHSAATHPSILGLTHTEPIFNIHFGCCAFENAERLDDRRWHAVLGLIDLEILK